MMPDTVRDSERRVEPVWSVFVGFDNPQSRERASEVCEFMTRQFWPEIEFDLHLCDFSQLGEPDYRRNAVNKAAAARILIIASSELKGWEPPLLEWIEGMCAQRHGREGALVGLVNPDTAEDLRDAMELQLRQLAHRAGLDYLTHAPDCRALCMPGDSEWVESRAESMGSVMLAILEKPAGPAAALR